MLKTMMGKEKDADMEAKMEAKMEVLRELMEMADGSETAGLMDGMGKRMEQVTVAAPDRDGLKEGIEKAEEMLDVAPDAEDMEEMADAEMMDEAEEYEEEDEDEVM